MEYESLPLVDEVGGWNFGNSEAAEQDDSAAVQEHLLAVELAMLGCAAYSEPTGYSVAGYKPMERSVQRC